MAVDGLMVFHAVHAGKKAAIDSLTKFTDYE